MLGYNMCATAMNASALITPNFPGAANQPPSSTLVPAMVDSMATYFVVNKREHLVRVTNSNPGVLPYSRQPVLRLLESAAVSPLLNIASVATVVWWPSFVDLRACSIALRIAEFVGIPSKQSQKNSCRRVDRSEELRTESLHKALFGFTCLFSQAWFGLR